jgi:hypothetical protein
MGSWTGEAVPNEAQRIIAFCRRDEAAGLPRSLRLAKAMLLYRLLRPIAVVVHQRCSAFVLFLCVPRKSNKDRQKEDCETIGNLP